MEPIKIKKLHPEAVLPTRAHPNDAGMDLYALADVPYKPGDCIVVPTGVAISVPEGYVGLVRDRSSVSKQRLKVTAGVIDAGYTGESCVVLLNLSGEHGCIKRGSKIAQMLLIQVATPAVEEVVELAASPRGAKGFGSSGV
jgi:dUTP pyrophosphatase